MNEELIIDGNLSQYEVPYEDERSEYFKKYNFGNGVECVTYIPENVNSDTNIMVYYPGSGFKADWYSGHHGSGNLSVQDYLMQNGSDTIILMPHANTDDVRTAYAVEMIEILQEEYNLTGGETSFGGFSLGAYASLKATALNIQNNPEIAPQICYSIDGYSSYYYSPSYVINEVSESFIQNGTILIGIETQYKSDVLAKYAKAGINVIKAVYSMDNKVDLKYGDTLTYRVDSGSHVAINQHFFKDGFLNFIDGNTTLPEGYTYQYYDLETNKWINIDAGEINTYEKLNAFFGNEIDNYARDIAKLQSLNEITLTDLTITSDSAFLQSRLNGIINKIKNTSFVQNGFGTTNITSDTKIPAKIPSLVQSFFETNANLLLKIANNMQEFAKIGPYFEQLDQEKEQEAIELTNDTTNISLITPIQESLVESTIDLQTIVSSIGTIANAINDSQRETTEPENSTTTTTIEEQTENNESEKPNEEKKKEPVQEENVKKEEVTKQENIEINKETQSEQEKEIPLVNDNQNTEQTQTNGNNGAQNQSTVPNTSQSNNSQTIETTNPLDEFPEYKEVYSDENKIVYDYNNEYKIVVHKDGDKIIGIEHYYDFGSETAADKALETLKVTYNDNENLENIIQKGQYIKVVFTEDMYENLTLNDIINQYKDLSEVIKL